MKDHPDYQHTRIAYGKDRCGNPPRPPPNSTAPTTPPLEELEGKMFVPPHPLFATVQDLPTP